jgi:hypothetical protein
MRGKTQIKKLEINKRDIVTSTNEIQTIIREFFENYVLITGKSRRNGYISRCI